MWISFCLADVPPVRLGPVEVIIHVGHLGGCSSCIQCVMYNYRCIAVLSSKGC